MTRAKALARVRNPLRQGVRLGVGCGDLCVEPMGRPKISHTKRISTLAWESGAGKVPDCFRVPKDPPLRFLLPSLFFHNVRTSQIREPSCIYRISSPFEDGWGKKEYIALSAHNRTRIRPIIVVHRINPLYISCGKYSPFL